MAKRPSSTSSAEESAAESDYASPPPPTKKSRVSTGSTKSTLVPSTPASLPLPQILSLSESKLNSLPKSTLVSYILTLQKAVGSGDMGNGNTKKKEDAAEDPKKIEVQVEKLRSMMRKGIQGQMKWQYVSLFSLPGIPFCQIPFPNN
jgi:hypothetical protein